jgi:hypothetical protein
MPPFSLLPSLAVAALLALVTSAALLLGGLGAPQLAAHVAFALGVLPLILAAMAYFVPVLTRSGTPGRTAWLPPILAWIGGALAVYSFATSFSPTALGLAASLGALAALALGGWTIDRARRMFGQRHRGLDWYLAALGFLLAALLAVVLMSLYPAQRDGLRLFHLHANLLGFVGLTALGTLQVLLPTCVGQADPDAAGRLRHDLKWAVAGALLVSTGSAAPLPPPLRWAGALTALAGTALYGWVVAKMLHAWKTRFGRTLVQIHGAAPSLTAAGLGLLGMLALGAVHGFGGLPARPSVAGFVIAFLLPLVIGAASHLLPVWLRPGVQGQWHRGLRARLVRWGGLRGLSLLLLGVAIAVTY